MIEFVFFMFIIQFSDTIWKRVLENGTLYFLMQLLIGRYQRKKFINV